MLIAAVLCCSLIVAVSTQFKSDVYPKTIKKYSTRIDEHTKQPVVSGLLHTLPMKSTLDGFRKHLQCTPKDPNLNYNNAIIFMLRMAPLTSETIRAVCSYIERRCEASQCFEQIPAFERGEYRSDENWNAFGGWSRPEMLRVINGTLYNDWPWGMERFSKRQCANNPLGPLLNLTLSRISDMRDSVFWTGGADPGVYIEDDFQFPYLSECTHSDFTDMIFPWINLWMVQLAQYKKMRESNISFTEEGYMTFEQHYTPWDKRVAKAALFGSYQPHRVFLFDIARLRPDLIDSMNEAYRCFKPWNPLSNETCADGEFYTPSTPEQLVEFNKLPPGYAKGLYNVTAFRFTKYFPAKYKYVVVPLGSQEVLSTSARIGPVLFFSGAVVLMPRSDWQYHFSAQFLPWVHYVPISFTGADLAEKVEWLKQHDDLAQQIAENGRNFARSYLRAEDLYCYAANTMDVMASLVEHTDATIKVHKPIVHQQYCTTDEELSQWYSWPV